MEVEFKDDVWDISILVAIILFPRHWQMSSCTATHLRDQRKRLRLRMSAPPQREPCDAPSRAAGGPSPGPRT